MKINFRNNMLKDTFYTVMPLNWFLRITGLSCIHRKGSHFIEAGSIIKCTVYIIIFGVLNIISLYFKQKSFVGNKVTGLVKFSDCVQLIYWLSYFEYIIDIYIVYKYGRDSLIKYFNAFDYIDSLLGVLSYDDIRETVVNSTTISLVVFVVYCVAGYITWTAVSGWLCATAYSIEHLYFYFGMLKVLDIISHVIQVEHRLKMIRSLLKNNDNRIMETIIDFDEQKVKMPVIYLSKLSFSKYLKATSFSNYYLLLLEQVLFVNSTYGFRILVYCYILLINVVGQLNLAIRIINGTIINDIDASSSPFFIIMPALLSMLRALHYEVILILLIYSCEQVYKQTEKILETIDEILASKEKSSYLQTNVLDIRNLLITRPIKFHAAKFFTIDYTLFVSFNSVVATYTIIMLQSMQ